MIVFSCSGCHRSFTVPDTFANRRAKCKGCGTEIVVPANSTASAPPASAKPAPVGANGGSPAKVPVRTRRLMSDAAEMKHIFADFPLIRVRPIAGDPPEIYEIEYRVRGLVRRNADSHDDPIPCELHRAQIELTSEYPRMSPKCKMLTPIFHPNIDPATICVGDHWAAGERLVDLVVRIGEMIAYQAYNIRSPLDGEAAMWADLNPKQLPVDTRDLHPPALE